MAVTVAQNVASRHNIFFYVDAWIGVDLTQSARKGLCLGASVQELVDQTSFLGCNHSEVLPGSDRTTKYIELKFARNKGIYLAVAD